MNNPYCAPNASLSDIGTTDDTYEPRLFALNGRIGRLRYLAYYLCVAMLTSAAAGIAAAILTPLLGSTALMIGMGVLIYVPILAATFVVTRRRLNDLNHSGWWGLLMLIPLANLLLGLYLVFAPGTQGMNNYGPKPCKNSTGVILGALILPIIAVIGILAAVAIPAYQTYVMKAKNAAQVQKP